MSLPGGWIADRLLGQRRAVLYGGILIACGHFSLAVPIASAFYLGLVLIVLGTGLLKPNISVIVGQLYDAAGHPARRRLLDLLHGDQPRRVPRPADHRLPRAGSRLPRHGSRAGAWIRTRAWHWGFGAAGVGMTLGLVQYVARRSRASARPGSRPAARPRRRWPRSSSGRRALLGRRGARRAGRSSGSLAAAGVDHDRRRRQFDNRRRLLCCSLITVAVLRLAVSRSQLDARGARAAVRDRRVLRLRRRSSGRSSSRPGRR